MITVLLILVIMALVVYIGLSYAKWRNPIIGIDYSEEEDLGVTEKPIEQEEQPQEQTEEPQPQEESEPVDCHSETHRIQTSVSNHKTDSRILIGTYDYNEECGCEWEATGFEMEKGNTPFLDLDSVVFYEGNIYAFIDKYNFLDEQVMRVRTLHHGKSGNREDFFDVTQKAGVDFNEEVKKVLSLFSKYITFEPNSKGYSMMAKLLREAWYQLHRATDNGLPILWKPINFPDVIDTYGNESDKDLAWRSMVGLLYATVIAELKPDCRNEVLSIGYNYGADKFTDPYKYEFKTDPNVGRMVGLCVYSAMRGQFNIGKIRKEVGGCKFDRTVHQVAEDSYANQKTSFFLDLQSFMPSAPGPYLKGYEDRTHAGGEPYPEAPKTADRNLQKDQEIEDFVVKELNIKGAYGQNQSVVQAIADKEGSVHHLLGGTKITEHFEWNSVFKYNIPDTGKLADLLEDVFTIGVMSRKPLMEGACYGRRRPGQSEIDGKSKEGKDGVLINYEIEEHDGNPTGYNQKGELVYVKDQKNSVYANSYPSGHSSGIFASALYLMELEPQEADIRLREANNFAMGRVICRYHHNSDTIVGRVIGAMISSCIRATSDYDERIKDIEL